MNVALMVLALAVQQPQDTVVLKPVVVTATRVPTPADVIASAVTVIRRADLEARGGGIRTVADALRTVPGVTIVETGSFGGQTSLFLRGGESDYVKVLLDGVPLNQPGGGIDLAHLTTDNVDRIEIVRGPGSVVYGSDAMTGVIQIFTRKGTGTARMGAELRAGTYGAAAGAVDFVGRAHKISYSASASRFSADGLYRYNNEYRNAVASARVTVTPDARSELSVAYRYGDDIYHFPTDGTGAPRDSNQRSAERGPLISLEASRAIGARLEARVLGTWRETRSLFNDEPDSPGEDGTFWSRDYVRRASAGTILTWRPQERLSFTGGVEYEDQRQRGTSEFSASFGSFPDSIEVQRFNTAYYIQSILGNAEPFAITVGARLDDNSQFGNHGTYRVGFVYHPRPETRLRVSAGSGFKEPTFFENYAHGFVQGNPNLEPEQSTSWEAGVDRTLAAGRISLSATYFRQRFRDLIDFTFSPPPGQPNYFNVAGAGASGVEAELRTTISPDAGLSLRYTYLRSRADEAGADSSADALFVPGEPLVRRPAHTLVPQLDLTLGTRARLTLGGRWVGKWDDLDFRRPSGDRRVTLGPYAQLDVAAQYDLGRVVLSGSLKNAFNDRTEETPGFRPRGRTVLIGARLSFGL
jgi:vitamin B12 transporter